MKKILLIITVSMATFCQLAATNSSFEWVNTLRYESMNSLAIRGKDTILIVGYNGLIAKSVDHGHNLSKQYLTPNNYLNDVLFCSSNTAIAVGNKGTIFKSEDAGTNWTKINSGTTYNIKALAAASIDNIWAVGDSSLILHSTDRGQTWQKVNLASSLTYFSDVDFKNSTGYIVGNYNNIYKSADNGNNWTRVTDNLINNSSNYTYSLSMTEHKTAMLGFNSFYYSNDNTNWIKKDINIDEVKGLHFVTDSIAYATTVMFTTCGCGEGKVDLYKSTDGGANWSNIFTTGGGGVSKFKFVNDSVGYFLTDHGLYITPATGEFGNYIYSALEATQQQPTVSIKQISNKLIVNSANKVVKAVEIRNASGLLVNNTAYQNSLLQVELNIDKLPKGIYLTRAILNDNSAYSLKWIKE